MKQALVGLLYWRPDDGIATAICAELIGLGYGVVPFLPEDTAPKAVDIVLTYAPYGPWLPIARKVAAGAPDGGAPVFVHWNTEGMPDLRLPRGLLFGLSSLRSRLGLVEHDLRRVIPPTLSDRLRASFRRRAERYRFVGDYYRAYRQGWLHVLADCSAVYADIQGSRGLPVVVAHWGCVPAWTASLSLERDIDVLWMGKYASRRRRRYLTMARNELETNGVTVYMADNEENPFVFGQERTRLLNRTKIVINVTRTWYDDNLLRFAIAAPNRAMIVSEHMLDHCPPVKAGQHYAACAPEQLATTILYYLDHEAERQRISENAYRLFTEKLTFRSSVATIMAEAEKVLQSKRTLSQTGAG